MRTLLVAFVPVAALLVVAPLPSAPVPKKLAGEGTIYVWSYTQPPVLNLYTPDGEHLKELKFGTKKECQVISISPGGLYAAVTSRDDQRNPVTECQYTLVYLVPLAKVVDELPEPIAVGGFNNLCWAADGRTAYLTMDIGVEVIGRQRTDLTQVVEYDTSSGRNHSIEIGSGHDVLDVSADGQAFLTSVHVRQRGAEKFNFAHIVHPQSGDTQPLNEGDDFFVRSFHPDGKRVFAWRIVKQGMGFGSLPPQTEDLILDPDTGTTAPLEWAAALRAVTGSGGTRGWSISPDRKRVVVKWSERMWVSKNGGDKGWHWVDRLGVCDLNGRHFKAILTAPPEGSSNRRDAAFSNFAWR